MPSSKATFREVGPVTVVDLSGLLTLGESCVLLRRTISDLVQMRRTMIILNFRNVTGIDSAGVAEIIASFKVAKNEDGHVKLLNLPPKISDLLALARLTSILEVYTDEATAIRSFVS